MILFIRIPKNASTSLYSLFGKHNIVNRNIDVFFDDVFYSDYCQEIYEPSHLTMDMAVKHLGEDILELPSVCVYRDPKARIVSAYEFAIKEGLFKMHGQEVMTFTDFCIYYCNNKYTAFHFYPQVKWIEYKGLPIVEHVLNFDNLKEDVENFCNTYNLDLGSLEHLNATQHQEADKYYTSELSKLVEKTYAEDYNYFTKELDYEKVN